MNQDRIPFLRKLGYGAGDTPLSLFFTSLSLYFLFFLTDVAGVPPAVAAVYGVGRIWDAVSDPIMGYVSDRTLSPLGRRRPYILFDTPLLAAAFVLLFRAYPGVPIGVKPFRYALAVYILSWVTMDIIGAGLAVLAGVGFSAAGRYTCAQPYSESVEIAGRKSNGCYSFPRSSPTAFFAARYPELNA